MSPVKVYVSVDMEGVTGVTHPEDVIPGRSHYEGFRKLLTADVNAAIEGASEGGATEFIVNEAHDGMRNLVLDGLDPRAEVIVGRRKPFVMMEDVEGADVAFFVGYHAGAGTKGVLSHTFRTAPVVGVTLNDDPCSEGRMNAAYAGLRRIPVGLVSGDDAVCEESRGLYTGVRTVQVKTAIDRYSARCLTPETSHRRIRDEAKAAVEGVENIRAYAPEPPYTFAVEFDNASSAASVLYFPGIERLDNRLVSWTHEDYEVAYKMFIGVMGLVAVDPDFG